jgi:hypothetical protein
VKFKKEHLSEMPVLDVNALEGDKRSALLRLYEKTCKLRFKALPQEFAEPSARRVIDEEIGRILGLKLRLEALYELLSKEPMLTG